MPPTRTLSQFALRTSFVLAAPPGDAPNAIFDFMGEVNRAVAAALRDALTTSTTTGVFVPSGGMAIDDAYKTLTHVDVGLDILGSRKRGKADVVNVSLGAYGPDGKLVAWSQDVNEDAPGAPSEVTLRGVDEHGPTSPMPFPPEVKAAIKARTKKVAPKTTAAVLSGDGDVWAIAFSPDGQTIATADATGTVRAYDTTNGHLLFSTSVAKNPIRVVAFSPDGTVLVSGGKDIKRLDPKTGTVLDKLASHKYEASTLRFSLDGKRVLSSGGGKLVVWDLATKASVYDAPLYDGVSVELASESQVIVGSDASSTGIRRFDLGAKPVKNNHAVVTLASRFGKISDGIVHIAPKTNAEGYWLEDQGTERTFVVRDTWTLEAKRSFSVPVTGGLFATDGNGRLAIVTAPHTIDAVVVDTQNGAELFRVSGSSPTGIGAPWISALAFASDGRIAVGAGRGVSLWGADGKLILAPKA